MRHNPAAGAVVIMLPTLKMHGMAQAVGELTEQGSPAFEAALPILSQLLKAETADREVRSTAYQLKAARFPNYRDLAGFDFASSEVNEALTRQLHRCEFLEDAHNVVLVGGPGTGKTHLATAIGVQAIEHHRKRVRLPRRPQTSSHREPKSDRMGHALFGRGAGVFFEQRQDQSQYVGYIVCTGLGCRGGRCARPGIIDAVSGVDVGGKDSR